MLVHWTAERVQVLRQRWNEGATASAIAKELSIETNLVSRNAVIGKAHRMGLPARQNRIPDPESKRSGRLRRRTERLVGRPNHPKQPTPAAASPPSTPAQLPQDPPEPAEIDVPGCGIVSHGVGIAELKIDSCRWIEGSPSDAIYCGAASEPQGSYCTAHARLAYTRRMS